MRAYNNRDGMKDSDSDRSGSIEGYEVSDEDDDTPYGRLSVDPRGLEVANKAFESFLFKSVEEVNEAQIKMDELYNKIRAQNVSVEQNIQDMAKEGYKLDMFRRETLEKMTDNADYTMRIFVKGAQNLSAVDNKVRMIRNQLAGDKALSSADPYLVMRIMGEEENLFYDGYEKVQEETLDPSFFEQHEVPSLHL